MDTKDPKKTVILKRARWALLGAALLVGASMVFVLTPARAVHRPQLDIQTQFHERVELGDPGKTGALFIYCDTGYRVWVATTPSGNVSVHGMPARDACPVDLRTP
jgi:hypothetical protein